MARLYEIAERHKAALLARDREASKRLIEMYAAAQKRIAAQAAQTLRLLARLEQESPDYLDVKRRQERLQALETQIAAEIERLSNETTAIVTAQQTEAFSAGTADALDMLASALPAPGIRVEFNALSVEAVEAVAGFTAEGSPVHDILLEAGREAARTAAEQLAAGVARGVSPVRVARQLRRTLGVELTRALTIARTETLRAYREATRQVYAQNSDIVQRMQWVASFSTRTCALCLALHGKLFRVDEPAPSSHPNCRCVFVPVLKPPEELGLEREAAPTPVPSASEWLDSLPREELDEIMGPGKAEAYLSGTMKLDDLIGRRVSEDWGVVYYERSLTSVMASRKRKR